MWENSPILQNSDELCGQPRDVPRVAQPPMTTPNNHFFNASNSRRHDWQADGSCFQEDAWQSFPMRREQKGIEYFHDGRDIPSPPGEMQPIVEPALFNQRFDPQTQISVPNQDEASLGCHITHLFGYGHKIIWSLLRL
jgi:hypothetical protein